MLRKPITYKNPFDQEVTEEFFFHLTKADLIKLQVNTPGGFVETLDAIGSLDPKLPGNAAKILQFFEDIIRASFGKQVQAGEEKRFVKRPIDWEEFVATDAYSNLLMELIGDGAYAAQFVKSILPADLDLSDIDKAAAALEAGSAEDVQLPDDEPVAAWIRERREPTTLEFAAMEKPEMLLAFKAKTTGVFPGDE